MAHPGPNVTSPDLVDPIDWQALTLDAYLADLNGIRTYMAVLEDSARSKIERYLFLKAIGEVPTNKSWDGIASNHSVGQWLLAE